MFDVKWLGRQPYEDVLILQEQLVLQRQKDEIQDTLLLLEHEPIYTIGRRSDQSSLQDPESLPHPVVEISRGGQATYHGPGQLVGYPILDLTAYGKDLHRYLRALEQCLIDLCRSFDVDAQRREGLTGVWIQDRKIASIGVGVRRWVSMHGFALNVEGQLGGFDAIVPCGIQDVTMTALTDEKPHHEGFTVSSVAEVYPPFLGEALKDLKSPTE